MSRPLIQVEGEVREMTDDEYAQYLAITSTFAQTDKPTASEEDK